MHLRNKKMLISEFWRMSLNLNDAAMAGNLEEVNIRQTNISIIDL